MISPTIALSLAKMTMLKYEVVNCLAINSVASLPSSVESIQSIIFCQAFTHSAALEE